MYCKWTWSRVLKNTRNLTFISQFTFIVKRNLTLNFPTTRPSSSNSSTPCFPRYNSKVWSHSVKPSNSGWFSSSLGNTFIIATEAFDFFLCILGLKEENLNITPNTIRSQIFWQIFKITRYIKVTYIYQKENTNLQSLRTHCQFNWELMVWKHKLFRPRHSCSLK